MLKRTIASLFPICMLLLSHMACAGFMELPHDEAAKAPCRGAEVMDCALPVANEMAPPLDGYKLVKHAARNVVVGREYTKVATVLDVVWRNEEANGCIYGTKVVALVGRDERSLNINAVSRSGYKDLPVAAAYASPAGARISVFGIARTASEGNGTIVFDTEVNPPKRLISPMLYVKTTCLSATPDMSPNAIRLRQAEEPSIELSIPGFVPAVASAGTVTEKPFEK
jgi:hypothetical protein